MRAQGEFIIKIPCVCVCVGFRRGLLRLNSLNKQQQQKSIPIKKVQPKLFRALIFRCEKDLLHILRRWIVKREWQLICN